MALADWNNPFAATNTPFGFNPGGITIPGQKTTKTTKKTTKKKTSTPKPEWTSIYKDPNGIQFNPGGITIPGLTPSGPMIGPGGPSVAVPSGMRVKPPMVSGVTTGNPVPKKRTTTKSGKGGGGGGGGAPTAQISTKSTGTGGAPTTAAPVSTGLSLKDIQKLLAQLGGGVDTKGISKEAAKLAKDAVAAQVADFVTQQQQIQNQGRSQALNILAASRAAANLQNNFGNALNDAYKAAADDERAVAGMYAGDLRTLAEGEAAQLARQVEAAGGTATPPVANVPINAYNALFGLQGDIPSSGLSQQAIFSEKQAQALPMLTRGAGTHGALLTQGAANQQANALLKNIANARAQLPRLTQQYVNSLTSAAASGQKNKLAALSLMMKAAAEGDDRSFDIWKTKLQYGAKDLDRSIKVQQWNAKYDLDRWKAQQSVNASRIRNSISRSKEVRLAGTQLTKTAQALSRRISDLVFGEFSKPTTSGGRDVPPKPISAPEPPWKAANKLFLEFPTIPRKLIFDELRKAYGPRMVVTDPTTHQKIIIGWPTHPESKLTGVFSEHTMLNFKAFPIVGGTVYTQESAGSGAGGGGGH